jgi:uncharacterized membrane protein
VVLFLGNFIITAWWKMMADRTHNPSLIAFAQRSVTVTDWLFTTGGSLVVLILIQIKRAKMAAAFAESDVIADR